MPQRFSIESKYLGILAFATFAVGFLSAPLIRWQVLVKNPNQIRHLAIAILIIAFFGFLVQTLFETKDSAILGLAASFGTALGVVNAFAPFAALEHPAIIFSKGLSALGLIFFFWGCGIISSVLARYGIRMLLHGE